MASRRTPGGGGQPFGRGGSRFERGEGSNGAGGAERTEAARRSSDLARMRAARRYVNLGMPVPPAYYRRESIRYADVIDTRDAGPRRTRSSSPAAPPPPEPEPEPEMLPGREGDYVADADLERVVAALADAPTLEPEDFVRDEILEQMVQSVEYITATATATPPSAATPPSTATPPSAAD